MNNCDAYENSPVSWTLRLFETPIIENSSTNVGTQSYPLVLLGWFSLIAYCIVVQIEHIPATYKKSLMSCSASSNSRNQNRLSFAGIFHLIGLVA